MKNKYELPKKQDFNLEGVKHLSVNDAYKGISKNEIYFLDIREQDEVMSEFFEFQNLFFFPSSNIFIIDIQ
ncbi:MAG: hypothetical protein LBR55_01450 [Bacteroidales bacterium]|jgi:hypothetical protein|nr:hypothetical protein [Bacteroidales bacterium]